MIDHLTVATLNIFGPANADWPRRGRVLASTLQDISPDVVVLQEVPVDDLTVAEQLLGPGYTCHPFSRPADDGVAGLLATRTSSGLVREIDQRCTPRAHAFPWCATLFAEVATPLGSLLAVHHKPSWQFGYELERERQALALAEQVEAVADDYDHVIIMGDFDATPDSASLQFLRGRRPVSGMSVCYQDAWETLHPYDAGLTFDSRNPLVRTGEVSTAVPRRIDYVLVRAGIHGPTLQVRRCERLLDEPVDGVWASDHFGVVAELTLPQTPPGSSSIVS